MKQSNKLIRRTLRTKETSHLHLAQALTHEHVSQQCLLYAEVRLIDAELFILFSAVNVKLVSHAKNHHGQHFQQTRGPRQKFKRVRIRKQSFVNFVRWALYR